jgi:hypothetical protein
LKTKEHYSRPALEELSGIMENRKGAKRLKTGKRRRIQQPDCAMNYGEEAKG